MSARIVRPREDGRSHTIDRTLRVPIAAIGLAARRRRRSLRYISLGHVPLGVSAVWLGECLFVVEIVVS
jgi:hypothetical protein